MPDLSQNSVTSQLLRLAAASNLTDFEEVVEFLKQHLDEVITEVHSFDKLLIDDGVTCLNAPPAPEKDDSHGGLLLRTISEQSPDHEHFVLSREFKVHDLGKTEGGMHKIEIRCDVTRSAEEGHKFEEEKTIVEIKRKD